MDTERVPEPERQQPASRHELRPGQVGPEVEPDDVADDATTRVETPRITADEGTGPEFRRNSPEFRRDKATRADETGSATDSAVPAADNARNGRNTTQPNTARTDTATDHTATDDTATGDTATGDTARTFDTARTDTVRTDTTAGTAPDTATQTHADVDDTAALFSTEEADRYLNDWRSVQASFVDDPQAAVGKAEALVGHVIDDVTSRISKRRAELSGRRTSTEGERTEQLRQALRGYRALLRQLVPNGEESPNRTVAAGESALKK